MTQDQINKRTLLRRELEVIRVRHTRELQEVQLELASQPTCDHKHPSGASAVVAGFMFDTCSICFMEA